MAIYKPERQLILAKTYPSPSARYQETSCVASISENGQLRRLFPVPYRLLGDENQFKKWQWIEARVAPPNGDRRPESRRIDIDSIVLSDTVEIGKNKSWSERKYFIEPHVIHDFEQLELRRKKQGNTLGIIRPKLIELQITPELDADWTKEELEKLRKHEHQEGLWDKPEIKHVLRKLPFAFHYRYLSGGIDHRHKIVDWEAGALFWNCWHKYGKQGWESKFRDRLFAYMNTRDIMFLMGTIHRFPDKWLIVSLLYPPIPKEDADNVQQLSLGIEP